MSSFASPRSIGPLQPTGGAPLPSGAAAQPPKATATPTRRRRLSLLAGVTIPLGAIAILPLIAIAMGLGSGDFKNTLLPAVPTQNSGTYVGLANGAMQLYTWSDDPGQVPPDAPTFTPAQVRDFVFVQTALGAMQQYRLFDLTSNVEVPLRVRSKTDTVLTMGSDQPLAAGDYELIDPTEGMFGGTDYQYFRVAATGGGQP